MKRISTGVALLLCGVGCSAAPMSREIVVSSSDVLTTSAMAAERVPAAASSVAEKVGKHYFSIAELLSQVRNQKGDVCDSGAFQGHILQALQSGAAAFGTAGVKATSSAAITQAVGNTLTYKTIMGVIAPFEADASKLAEAVVNTVFYSRAMGAYGSTTELHFAGGGKLKVRQLVYIEAKEDFEWREFAGTWELRAHMKGKDDRVRLSIRHPWVGGKLKTEAYRIEYDYSAAQWNLKTGNDRKGDPSDSNRFFDQVVDECDA